MQAPRIFTAMMVSCAVVLVGQVYVIRGTEGYAGEGDGMVVEFFLSRIHPMSISLTITTS
jgi:hypothetical protein